MNKKLLCMFLALNLITLQVPGEVAFAAEAAAKTTASEEYVVESEEAGDADADESAEAAENAEIVEAADADAETDAEAAEDADAPAEDDAEASEIVDATSETDASASAEADELLEEDASEEVATSEQADGSMDAEAVEEAESNAPSYAGGDETSYVIRGVENIILSGLNYRGQIIAGRDVSFGYVDLMERNATLFEALENGKDTVVGIRKSSGETLELTPETTPDGIFFHFTAPSSDAWASYWITVKLVETGEVFESSTPLTVNPDPIVLLTLEVEGEGSITASSYEVTNGEEIALTIEPAEGWYFDKLVTVSGSFGYRAGMKDTIYLEHDDTVIRAVFKQIVTSGYCGENAVYTFDIETGLVTITGTGEIRPSAFEGKVGSEHDWDAIKTVVIKEGITGIGSYAFADVNNLQSVTLPEGLTTIGENAFYSCDSLAQINLPEGLERIERSAFQFCRKLTAVEFPASLTTLCYDSFSFTALRSVTVPKTVTTMEAYVFGSCGSLTSITIEAELEELPYCTFYECKQLKTVVLPNTIKKIGQSAFRSCSSMEQITLPDGIDTIEETAFEYCSSLRSIVIPDGVTRIEDDTFYYCKALASVHLPDNLQYIGYAAFENNKLKSITLPAGLVNIDDKAFWGNPLSGNLTIPDHVVEIGPGAFKGADFSEITNNSELIVKLSDFFGTSDLDYQYMNSAGEAVASFGKGTYVKKVTAKDIAPAVVTGIANKIYTGKALLQNPVVRLDGKTLVGGTDYAITYKDNIQMGTATVTIMGIGSYTNYVTKTFLILPGKTTRGDMFNLANNVKVTWKEVPGAKYYKVYREGITNKSETRKDPVIVTTGLVGWDKDPGLTSGHAYKYKIVASLTKDSSGDSFQSYSKVMYRLKTVVIRSVKNTAPGKVTVKYDKTTSGDSYVLQYCEREDMVGAKTKVVLGASNTSYILSGLKKGKTYYISIRVRKKVDGIDYYTTFGVPKKVKIEK